ncbi:hypothetical protein ACFULT_07545 [Rhodococcus sp. NPDC057297]
MSLLTGNYDLERTLTMRVTRLRSVAGVYFGVLQVDARGGTVRV